MSVLTLQRLGERLIGCRRVGRDLHRLFGGPERLARSVSLRGERSQGDPGQRALRRGPGFFAQLELGPLLKQCLGQRHAVPIVQVGSVRMITQHLLKAARRCLNLVIREQCSHLSGGVDQRVFLRIDLRRQQGDPQQRESERHFDLFRKAAGTERARQQIRCAFKFTMQIE